MEVPRCKDKFLELPNRLLVVSALEQIDLPCAFGSDHKKVTTLMLNKEQKLTLSDPSKKKIITGNTYIKDILPFSIQKLLYSIEDFL